MFPQLSNGVFKAAIYMYMYSLYDFFYLFFTNPQVPAAARRRRHQATTYTLPSCCLGSSTKNGKSTFR